MKIISDTISNIYTHIETICNIFNEFKYFSKFKNV